VTGRPVTVEEMRRHAECMRSHGFNVPDPIQTPEGWQTIIDELPLGLDLNSGRFREAMFVTCGPLGAPLSGDMVIGGPREKVDRFIACMSAQGFDLPGPTEDPTGAYDIDEWTFDLTSTDIDTSGPDWNRAVFVTCSPSGF
jgi:hypothetical protein